MRIVTRMAILEGVKMDSMDNYEVGRILSNISRGLEDLTYRLYTLEEAFASMSSYLEEQEEESLDA